MKFLPRELIRPHMIPLNMIYYRPDNYKDDDILTVVYKDQDSNERIVHHINRPEIELYVVKEEYRDFSHMRDWFDKSKCTMFKVRYATRWREAARIMHIDYEQIKTCPYIFNIDIAIETYYLIQFITEYPSDKPKTISVGTFDIENDIIRCDKFAAPGETPINAITYINMPTKDVYTQILLRDNLPVVPIDSHAYPQVKAMKDKFYEQVEYVRTHQEEFIKLCHDKFDEMHPGMNYNLLLYDDEQLLLKDFWDIIHATDNDYLGAWNVPYDIQNIIERIKTLGMNPNEIIPDKRFRVKQCSFKEDTNPVAHKRRHLSVTNTIPSVVDFMVYYAGIRSGSGVKPSLKLNNVAKVELGDEKYDYTEVSDIKHLFYDDLIKFMLYNIKDSLLLDALERKNKDMSNIYSRTYQTCVFPHESFVTTKVVWHSLIKFMVGIGHVPGINRNKGNKSKAILDYSSMYRDQIASVMDEDDDDIFSMDYISPDDFESEDDDDEDEKFQGAFVSNTLHMQPTGVEVMGKPSQFIHDNVVDNDVGSEYPTAVNTCNISNETLVGKVFFDNPDEIDIPIPEGFVFRGNDRKKYKMDKSNYLLEVYTEGDVFSFGSLFLGLPTQEEMFEDIATLIKKK